MNEKTMIGSLDVAYALEEVENLVLYSLVPLVFVRTSHEVLVLLCLEHGRADH